MRKMRTLESSLPRVETEEDQGFSDKLDLLKFAADIHSGIKDSIKQDITLAKLEGKDKEFVIEMTKNAYFVKSIFHRMTIAPGLTPEEKEYCRESEKDAFQSIMIGVIMVMLTNRNVKNNYLLELIAGESKETTTIEPEEEKQKPIMQKVKEKLRPED